LSIYIACAVCGGWRFPAVTTFCCNRFWLFDLWLTVEIILKYKTVFLILTVRFQINSHDCLLRETTSLLDNSKSISTCMVYVESIRFNFRVIRCMYVYKSYHILINKRIWSPLNQYLQDYPNYIEDIPILFFWQNQLKKFNVPNNVVIWWEKMQMRCGKVKISFVLLLAAPCVCNVS
jgi:hypothetical protein